MADTHGDDWSSDDYSINLRDTLTTTERAVIVLIGLALIIAPMFLVGR